MNVACVGGVNLDLKARATFELTLASSNPGQIHRSAGGVAGNVAQGLARLGVATSVFSVVGDDAAGRLVIDACQRAGVDTAGITCIAGARTATYAAVLDRAGELIVAIADAEVLEEACIARCGFQVTFMSNRPFTVKVEEPGFARVLHSRS